MSLIRDALIKAEREIGPSHRPKTNSGDLLYNATRRKAEKNYFIPIFLGSCFFFTALILTLVVIYKPTRPPVHIPPKKAFHPEPLMNALLPDFDFLEIPEIEDNFPEPDQLGIEIALNDYEPPIKDHEHESSDDALIRSLMGTASKIMHHEDSTTPDETAKKEETKHKIPYSVSSEEESTKLIQEEEKRRQHFKLDPIDQFVNNMTITGVMFSDNESKVLMNNHVYSINSEVSKDPKLKLVEITPHALIFADEHGRRHRKEF